MNQAPVQCSIFAVTKPVVTCPRSGMRSPSLVLYRGVNASVVGGQPWLGQPVRGNAVVTPLAESGRIPANYADTERRNRPTQAAYQRTSVNLAELLPGVSETVCRRFDSYLGRYERPATRRVGEGVKSSGAQSLSSAVWAMSPMASIVKYGSTPSPARMSVTTVTISTGPSRTMISCSRHSAQPPASSTVIKTP